MTKEAKKRRPQDDPFEVVEAFAREVSKFPAISQLVYVGIDPGMTGAIALLYREDPSLATAIDIPVITIETTKKTKSGKRARRTKFDPAGCKRVFDVLTEYVSAKRIRLALEQGAARDDDSGLTGFSVGVAYGMWPLFLYERGIQYEELLPTVWKRRMGLQGKNKQQSRLLAQRLFPNAPLWRKADHNRAEALLLAESLRRSHDGQS